jgi:hypothetical protein
MIDSKDIADNVEQFRGNPYPFCAPKDVWKPVGIAFAITLFLKYTELFVFA